MKLKRGLKYRHRNCLDMDILVTKVCFVGKVYTTVKVLYVSQRNSDLVFCPDTQTIRLYNRNFKDWKELPYFTG